ncbi:caspase family protein [Streptomyces verrucosisporus]|uniref:caspase, EACC1-associated type n=1 Tax=Streptomyces verrucosisporus TaxID=1695161 RepID=UPI0019D026F6|nr:caspase family protein [Streptomyces verrucosisporus]MBN3932633.1 caspase family protein [Streptomyces verrucosisporus]
MSGRTSLPELPPGRRSALVVAVSSYADAGLARLRAPARDAEALAEVLGAPEIGGFDVRGLTDPTAQEIRSGVDDFLSGRGTDELLLVYFSCHGLLDARGRLYFAGADTRKERLASTGVESGWLLEQLDECRARRQVVILDCCFSGAFARGTKSGERDVDLESRIVGHGRGRTVLTASRSREYSFEGESLTGMAVPEGSVFTTGLVDGLRTGAADADGDGYISVEDAFDHASAYVVERGAKQTPQRWVFGGEGRIWLARAAVRAAAGDDLPEALRMALDNPLPAVRVAGVMALGEWLSEGGEARFRLARRYLERIAATDDPAVARAARALLPPPEAASPAAAASPRRRPAQPRVVQPPPRQDTRLSVVQPPPQGAARSHVAPSPSPPPKKAAAGPGLLHTLPVWDTPDDRGQLRWISGMAVHPTAPLVAVATNREPQQHADGGPPQLWDPVEGRLLHTLHGHDDPIQALAFSPDGDFLATSSYEDVRIWDAHHWRHLLTLTNELGLTSSGQLAFAPGGRLLATDKSDGTVQIWESSSGREVLRVGRDTHGRYPRVTVLAFSHDGLALAIGTDSGVVRVLDVASGRQLLRSKCHGGWVTGLVFGPGDRQLVSTGSVDASVILWDTEKWRALRKLQVGEGGVGGVEFSPHDGLLAVSTGLDVRLLRPDTGQHVVTLGEELGDATEVFAFSHDGGLLACAGVGGEVGVWDARNKWRMHRLTGGHERKATHLGFTPDDRHLITGGSDSVCVWRVC